FVKNELKVRLRTVGQYSRNVWADAKPDSLALNENKPMYEFSTRDLAVGRAPSNVIKSITLDAIKVVPNPYYGYSAYERSQVDNYVKIINLPKTCTISIYTLNGNLIRRFTKDTDQTWLDWNIKNQYGIPISGGLYILHIQAPGLGEKIIKWFGALRPQDLQSL
ncbi:MAG: hypothetical protein J7L89_01370, partial [Bacteroidales bacterium]|nr:hypothetical protein [Bacteroidales bacterium]